MLSVRLRLPCHCLLRVRLGLPWRCLLRVRLLLRRRLLIGLLLGHRLLLIGRLLLLRRLRNRLAGRSLHRVTVGLPCALVSHSHQFVVPFLGLAKLIICLRNGLAVMLLLQHLLSLLLLLDLRLSLLHRLPGLLQFLKRGLVLSRQFQGLLSAQSAFVGFLLGPLDRLVTTESHLLVRLLGCRLLLVVWLLGLAVRLLLAVWLRLLPIGLLLAVSLWIVRLRLSLGVWRLALRILLRVRGLRVLSYGLTLLVASGGPFSALLLVYGALFGRGRSLISTLHGLLLVGGFGVWRILLVLALVSGLRLGVACGRLLDLLGRLLCLGVRTPIIRRGVVVHLRLLGLRSRGGALLQMPDRSS